MEGAADRAAAAASESGAPRELGREAPGRSLRETWAEWCRVFGKEFVIFIVAANFSFGVAQHWWWYFNYYFLRDDVGLGPEQSGVLNTVVNLALFARPLCGLVSDSVPLLGSTRRSYFVLSTSCSALAYALLACFGAQLGPLSVGCLLFAINFLGFTWGYAVLAAMIACASTGSCCPAGQLKKVRLSATMPSHGQ